jgi:hypothetical protein
LDPAVSQGRKSVEDSRRTGRLFNFQIHFRIEGAFKASPNASVRDFVQPAGIAESTVFYGLTHVLHLEIGNGRWLSHKLNDDPKQTRAQLVVSLQAEFEKGQRRNWMEFYTGD